MTFTTSTGSSKHGFTIGLAIAASCAFLQRVSNCSSGVAIIIGLICVVLSTLDWLKLQRQVEGRVGGFLLKLGTQILLEKVQLVPRQLTLKESGLTVHYLERMPHKSTSKTPTLLMCHGMASEPTNLVELAGELAKELPNWRLILPTTIGHGKDLERVWELGSRFKHPSPQEMGEPIRDLLFELGITECCAYGASLGGALVYFLQEKYPQLVRKSILISPAVEAVMDDQFVEDWIHGRKNHMSWENREDVKQFMEDLSCPPERRAKNPLPSFMLQAIWEDRQERAPPRHFRNFSQSLLDQRGQDPEWLSCEQDIAPDLPRLVLWPQDDYICHHDKGQAFFANSTNTNFQSIPDCGHLFHSNGKTILVHAAPTMIQYLLED